MNHLSAVLSNGLEQGVDKKIFPGGIASVSLHGKDETYTVAKGTVSYQSGISVRESSVYDLASLTKVVVTLPSILLSIQAGKLSLIDSITTYIPELSQNEDKRIEKIKIFHLLTHTSGLPAWRPFFVSCRGKEEYIQAIAREKLIGDPGNQVVYSDLGFMLLGFILERVWDQSLDQLSKSLIFGPLHMNDTTYNPLEQFLFQEKVIASTENGNTCEWNMALNYIKQKQDGLVHERSFKISEQQVKELNWRSGDIIGTVHDCNAHYGLQGVSGHAGLFSTVADMQKYMKIWSGEHEMIDPILRATAVSLQTGTLAPARALGWEHSSITGTPQQLVEGCSGGDLISTSAFGHTGFTGTSVWCDPVRGVTFVVLTNRVHPDVKAGMIPWRRVFHNQVFASIGLTSE